MKTSTLLLLIAIGYTIGFFALDRWKFIVYFGDSQGYFLHLVSFYINQDVGYYNKTIEGLKKSSPKSKDPRKDKFAMRMTDKGRRYIKFSLGVPIMESPFFLLAHAYVKLTGHYPDDGWSAPYKLLVSYSAIIYIILGLYLLVPILEKFFSKKAVFFSVLAVAFATNLFYHGTYVTMSHSFLFFDYCLLIWLTLRFYEKPSRKIALLIGGVVGLICITRVPEVISMLIPLLWGIISYSTLKERMQFFIKHPSYILMAGLGFIIIFSIQSYYWYYTSGNFIFNPYDGEGFDFFNPQILNGFFHFNNGWLIYTPIMAFSLIGLFFLSHYYSAPLLPIFAFGGLHIFIHYSYYAWVFFPGLGQRPMVEIYPLLLFSLTACFAFFLEKKWLAWIPFIILPFFTWLNLFQTWQMNEGVILSEKGSWAYYYETFGTLKTTKESLIAFDSKQIQPDTNDLKFMGTLAKLDFEGNWRKSRDSIIKKSGNFSYLTGAREFEVLINNIPLNTVEPNDWVKLKIDAFMRSSDKIWDRGKSLKFGMHLVNEKGEIQFKSSITLPAHIGNEQNTIWNTGTPDQWETTSFFLKIPSSMEKTWKARIITYSPEKQKLFLDNIVISHFRNATN